MTPATIWRSDGEDFTLVLPTVNALVMDLFPRRFADTLPNDVHAVLILDGAGWLDQPALNIPDNVTLVALPRSAPELNPVERVRLYLRERFLSLRILDHTEAIIDAYRAAGITLTAEPGRLYSPPNHPWIKKAISWAQRYCSVFRSEFVAPVRRKAATALERAIDIIGASIQVPPSARGSAVR